MTLSWTYDLVSYVSGVKWLLGACCVSTLHEVKEQQELQQHSGDTAAAVGTKLWQHYFDYGDVTSTVEKAFALRLIATQDLPDLPESSG